MFDTCDVLWNWSISLLPPFEVPEKMQRYIKYPENQKAKDTYLEYKEPVNQKYLEYKEPVNQKYLDYLKNQKYKLFKPSMQ